MGVHWVTREFLPLLQKGTLKKVANMQADHHHLNLVPNLTKTKVNDPGLYFASSYGRRHPLPRLQDLESSYERPHCPVRSRLRKGRLYIHGTLPRRMHPFSFHP